MPVDLSCWKLHSNPPRPVLADLAGDNFANSVSGFFVFLFFPPFFFHRESVGSGQSSIRRVYGVDGGLPPWTAPATGRARALQTMPSYRPQAGRYVFAVYCVGGKVYVLMCLGRTKSCILLYIAAYAKAGGALRPLLLAVPGAQVVPQRAAVPLPGRPFI